MNHLNLKKKPQRIIVFQQKGSGLNKIRGILAFGRDLFDVKTVDIDEPLPAIIEHGRDYLPESIEADLVLDYLKHLDLSNDLWLLCEKLGIPVVASNKKTTGSWAITPRVCCALPGHAKLGEYGKLFGAPELEVKVKNGLISEISVAHGAPCGATWEAAMETIGVPVKDAPIHYGLKTQFFCTANPAGWDVMYGKSPVHYAAELHKAALKVAIDRLARCSEHPGL